MKSPAFSFYVRDWLCSKTVSKLHSKPSSKGVSAYLYLLCSAWLEDPPATLPNDDDQLAGYARLSRAEWDALKPDIIHQFTVNSEGRLVNERLMAEWKKQVLRKSAGSKGGSKRVANLQAALENEIEDENEVQGKEKGSGGKLPAQGDLIGDSPSVGGLAQRIGNWFKRRPTTPWSPKELKAVRTVLALKTPAEDVALLEEFYTATIPSDSDFRRHDIMTLLNNWNTEIDRARRWKSEQGGRAKPNDKF